MSSSKTSSYHLFRRWQGATFTKLGLLSESMSVATASKLVTPLAVLIPVLAALAEAQVLTDSAWWLTLGAIVIAGAAQREYFEEAAVPGAQEYLRKTKSTGVFRTPDSVTVPVPIATRPIAYMRDLARAGLPDYFNLSYTELTAEQAIGNKALRSEKGLQTGMRSGAAAGRGGYRAVRGPHRQGSPC